MWAMSQELFSIQKEKDVREEVEIEQINTRYVSVAITCPNSRFVCVCVCTHLFFELFKMKGFTAYT